MLNFNIVKNMFNIINNFKIKIMTIPYRKEAIKI